MTAPADSAALKKVIIVGAGFAGLAAARRLASHGQGRWQATILEGSNRVGGRAHTVELPGCGRVEMGATWLHGLKGNPLYAYAVEKGIMSASATQKEGEWGNVAWAREGQEQTLAGQELKTAKAAAGSYSAAVEDSLSRTEPGLTVGQHLQQAWPQARERFDSDQQRLAAETWCWREKLQRSIDGCTTTGDMLVAGLADYDELDGLNCPVPGGFQGLATSMAAEGLDIQLDSTVQKIEWGDGAEARIVCENGQSHTADAVILTVSLGVLKANHKELFDPPLPPVKVAAISRMGMGTINKVFVVSQQPEQQKGRKSGAFNLLWAGADGEEPDGFLSAPGIDRRVSNGGSGGGGSSDRSSDRSSAGNASCSTTAECSLDWRKGAYAIRFKGSEFVTTKCLANGGAAVSGDAKVGGRFSGSAGVADVHAQPEPMQPAASGSGADSNAAACSKRQCAEQEAQQVAATMWLAGPEARAMEHRDEAQLRSGVDQMIDAFPPVRRQLPDVTAVYRSNWGSNPLTRGSYSYPAASSSPGDTEALTQPLMRNGRPVLLFAGEATHASHYGTASGAFHSGEREADRLLALP